MFKGFLSGLFWGGMVGALVLAVLSLYAPLPSTQADAEVGAQAPAAAAEPVSKAEPAPEAVDENVVETPEPEPTPEPAPTPEPVEETAPVQDEQSGEVGTSKETDVAVAALADDVVEIDASEIVAAAENTVPDDAAPDVASTLQVPSFDDTTDISAVKLPQVGDTGVEAPDAPNGIAEAASEPSDQPLVVAEKPIAALPVAVLKTSPDALGFADGVSVQKAPELAERLDEAPQTTTTALVAPVISELAPTPVENPPVENPSVVQVAIRPTQRTNSLPQVGGTATEVSSDTPIGVQVAPIENPVSPKTVQVVTGRLPTVGAAPAASPVVKVLTPEVENPSRGALSDHAAQFSTNAQSLFSVVIIDVGTDGVAREQLLNSSYPITVAIDPAAPDAAAVMSQYRAAGIEVVALLNDLPLAAAPGDVAVAVSGYFAVLDEAVAVMEPLDKRLQRDRNLLDPVLGALTGTGHGLMTYTQGLNSTLQSAKRSGVPAAEIFRVLDAEGEKSAKIKRYLKRAAFNAGKDGSVVVVGRSYTETMTAILEWALESNDATLSLAPISAVLKADITEGS